MSGPLACDARGYGFCLRAEAVAQGDERNAQRVAWVLGFARCQVTDRCLPTAALSGNLRLASPERLEFGDK